MYERLPEELKRSALCCLWKYEERQGKMTKVPYQLNGNRARTTDRKSFSYFRMIASRAQDYSGIGMGVFDGFCAVDIDGCIANEQLTTMAEDIIATMDSYTEYSPSGTGIRMKEAARQATNNRRETT